MDAVLHIRSCPCPSWTAAHKDQLRDAQQLKRKNGKIVCRVQASDGPPMILKLWEPQSGWVGSTLRRVLGRTPLRREAKMLEYLAAHDIPVPKVLGYGRLEPAFSPYVVGIALEDLGPLPTGLTYLKALLEESRLDEVERFEQRVIDLTAGFLAVGVADADHRLNNMLVSADGQPRRIDLELARRCWPPAAPRLVGRMLGHLLATYIFAIQPDLTRFEPFARGLADRVRPRTAALRCIEQAVGEELRRQRHACDIDTHVHFPW